MGLPGRDAPVGLESEKQGEDMKTKNYLVGLFVILYVLGSLTYILTDKFYNPTYEAPVKAVVVVPTNDVVVRKAVATNKVEAVPARPVVVPKKVVVKKVAVAMEYDLPGVDGNRLFDYLETAENPNGDPELVGDKHLRHRAYGLLQIRQPCLTDVIRIARKDMIRKYGRVLTIEDMKDRNKARWVARVYLHYYGKQYTKVTGKRATMKVYAMIHNGGPNGWHPRNVDARRYWAMVVRVNGLEIG